MEKIINEVYENEFYQIEYKPELSIKNNTTRHDVYHIKTTEENYSNAKKAINNIIAKENGYKAEDIWSKDEYLLINRLNFSIINAFHRYYQFSYDKDKDIYVYTFIHPITTQPRRV